MQFPRKARRTPAINIINLIDVLVVLLIFYIATTVFKKSQPKIDITVPSSTKPTVSQQAAPSIIYITADGKFYLDDQPEDPAQLGDLLKSKKATDPDFKVALKADTNTPLGMFVKVYDAANAAGITDLQMFVSPDKTQPSPGP